MAVLKFSVGGCFMYETNILRINSRIEAGLELLRKHYTVKEIPVGIFESFFVAERRHVVRQFSIEGVGNLLVMTNPDEGRMQMDTFTITPYYKNLPLFTTDYMYFEDKRMFLNEIYDLVEYKDALYQSFIEEFAANCAEYAHFENMPMRECWYDSIRPVVIAKVTQPENDEDIFNLFIKNLTTFIEMEKASPALEGEHLKAKWEKNYNYARSLVEDGGVSTELFVKSLGAKNTKKFFYSVFFAPDLYRKSDLENVLAFFNNKDENGETNLEKVTKYQKIIRRVETTDKNKSYEAVDEEKNSSELPSGVVTENGKLIGLGIHIFNEDVYPLQSFEIYLRNCSLTGTLNLSGCRDMIFLDVYHNKITEISSADMPSMRIFGVQDNLLEKIDVSEMPVCQGIDAGMNRLREIDVSENPELVELYINDNDFTEIDLSHNKKLKYFYCHNNKITELDTRNNILLRHLNATGNPMKKILSLAPQRDEILPLEIYAEDGGTVGLKFNPVYNAQWKETGEWQQSYYAYPDDGYSFAGWYDAEGNLVSEEKTWIDEYGTSRILKAKFKKKK